MQTVKIEDERILTVTNRILERERNISRHTLDRAECETSLKNWLKVINLYKRKAVVELYKDEGLPKEFLKELLENRRKRLTDVNVQVRTNGEYSRHLGGAIRDNEKVISTYEKKKRELERKHPSKLIHINDIKMQLASFPNVDWKRTHIHKDVNGAPYVNIYFRDVVCITNRNRYKNIRDKSWALGSIRAQFWLGTHKVKFLAADNAKYPKGYSGTRCHPHVLRDNTPCLGDFLGGLVEARENYDFGTIVSILQMFLEQAHDRDEAGSYWVRWALAAADEGRHIAWINECSYRETRSGIPYYGIPMNNDGKKLVTRIPILKNGVLEWHEAPYNSVELDAWAKGHLRN